MNRAALGRGSDMKAVSEHEGFSQRLQQALRNENHPPDSGTRLAKEFNRRFPGKPITPHAARKWLIGEAIPTQEKLVALANWLGVSAGWLRYGNRTDTQETTSTPRLEPSEVKLLRDLRMLDDRHRLLVREFIRMLIRLSHAPARTS